MYLVERATLRYRGVPDDVFVMVDPRLTRYTSASTPEKEDKVLGILPYAIVATFSY